MFEIHEADESATRLTRKPTKPRGFRGAQYVRCDVEKVRNQQMLIDTR
jgi:hypothetical protein